MTGRTAIPPYERVMARTKRTESGCLEFTGPLNRARNNYGMVGVGSKIDGTKTVDTAHRIVWAHHHGPIPKGKVVRHTCDNPPCVEITHLLLGTQKDNMADCSDRGRNLIPEGATCRAGLHEWSEENWTGGRVRRCKPCQRQRERESYGRRSA